MIAQRSGVGLALLWGLFAASAAAEERAPYGTFRDPSPHPGMLSLLVLKTDGKYHAEFELRDTSGRTQFDRGTYRITKRGRYKTKYIEFRSTQNVIGNRLKLHRVADGYIDVSWSNSTGAGMRLQRVHPAWCQRAADCRVQDLATPRCIGNWRCARAGCSFRCGQR
jgi:hypothetical protein